MNDNDTAGPYDAENGRCAQGHPVNAAGRCEPINPNGWQCDPVVVDDAPAEVDAPVVHVAEGIVVRPGDRVLIRVSPDTHPDDLWSIGVKLRERFPDGEVTVVAADQLVHIPAATLEDAARPLAPLPDAVAFDRVDPTS